MGLFEGFHSFRLYQLWGPVRSRLGINDEWKYNQFALNEFKLYHTGSGYVTKNLYIEKKHNDFCVLKKPIIENGFSVYRWKLLSSEK